MDQTKHDAGAELGKIIERIGTKTGWRGSCAVQFQDFPDNVLDLCSALKLFVVGIQIDRRSNAAVGTLDCQAVQGDSVIFGKRPKCKLIGFAQSLL